MIWLTQPGTGKSLLVADEHADFWRARGYRDAAPVPPADKPKATRSRKAAEPNKE